MRGKTLESEKAYMYYVLLFLVGIVTLLPVGCKCIIDGEFVTEWTAWVEEVSSGNIVHIYCICMLGLQMGTLLTSTLLFQGIFADRETRLPAFFGVLLYMTCPYRIYICYDYSDISQAAAWMLLPLYLWAVLRVAGSGRKWPPALAAAALAGGALFLPGLRWLMQYLSAGRLQEVSASVQSGYRLGDFFRSYPFHSSHPGMGMGMLICLLTGAWLGLVENNRDNHRGCRGAVILSALFAVLSLQGFPWEAFRKMGGGYSRLAALTGGRAVFWGMACFCLCVPAACAMDRISRHENRRIALAVPMLVFIACLGICVYQCNTLVYFRGR